MLDQYLQIFSVIFCVIFPTYLATQQTTLVPYDLHLSKRCYAPDDLEFTLVRLDGNEKLSVNVTWQAANNLWGRVPQQYWIHMVKVDLQNPLGQLNITTPARATEKTYFVLEGLASDQQYDVKVCAIFALPSYVDWNVEVRPKYLRFASPVHSAACAENIDYAVKQPWPCVWTNNIAGTTCRQRALAFVELSWNLTKFTDASANLWVRVSRITDKELAASTFETEDTNALVLRINSEESNSTTVVDLRLNISYAVQVCAFDKDTLPIAVYWSHRYATVLKIDGPFTNIRSGGGDNNILKVQLDRDRTMSVGMLNIVMGVLVCLFLVSVIVSLACHCLASEKVRTKLQICCTVSWCKAHILQCCRPKPQMNPPLRRTQRSVSVALAELYSH